jgi:outer membrane protein OmpA-like peptidoglycan-associated protein
MTKNCGILASAGRFLAQALDRTFNFARFGGYNQYRQTVISRRFVVQIKILKLSSLALALALSTSGCSWVRGMFSGNDENPSTTVAQAAQPAPVVNDAPATEPMRVAADHGHHVQDGTGNTVTSGYGDCVNIGYSVDGGKHPADCDKQGLKSDTASAAAEPAAPSMAKEEMATPAPEAATPKPLDPAGTGAPGIVQEDAGKATAQVQPADERPTVAPKYEKISLQGDALFRFGKSDRGNILPAGIEKLDELAAQLAAYDRSSVESITVVGHADRLGKKAANQALSERRARTVSSYLVSKGVDGSLISTMGKGSSQPVKQCRGKRKTPQLVACLEPNRRVEVVIRGIKGS